MARLPMLGGCGRQAQPAVDLLLDRGVFDAIILGYIDLELTQRLVSDRSAPRLSAVQLDAFDHRGMEDAMQDVDVVYNCSGPHHLLGLEVLRAAIEARRHYVDYCDDTEPTLDMLELNEEARQRGVTAIVGLGASPGCTSLLAKRAADELESVEEVNMYWSIAPGEPEGPAVLNHMFHISSSPGSALSTCRHRKSTLWRSRSSICSSESTKVSSWACCSSRSSRR